MKKKIITLGLAIVMVMISTCLVFANSTYVEDKISDEYSAMYEAHCGEYAGEAYTVFYAGPYSTYTEVAIDFYVLNINTGSVSLCGSDSVKDNYMADVIVETTNTINIGYIVETEHLAEVVIDGITYWGYDTLRAYN